jgi:phosphopantetheinyl transferase
MIDLWVERVRGGRAVAHEWANERIAAMQADRSDAPSSLSHHRDWLAIGVSSAGRLGVDVLTVPPNADFVDDTALVLSATEIEWVRAHSIELRGVAFAECWTRKEAYAKWRGSGLTSDLRYLTLTPVSDDTTVVFWTALLADGFVTVASNGPESPELRLHHR